MRRLTFEPWTPEQPASALLFTSLYQAFVGTHDNPNRSTSLEDTRWALKVLDGLDGVSDVLHPGTPMEQRSLKTTGGVMTLQEPAYVLLKQAVTRFASTVPIALARQAMQAVDFVEHATAAMGSE